MKKLLGTSLIILLWSFALSLVAQDCNNQYGCTGPMTEIILCPDFCTIGDDYTLSDFESLFECGLHVENDLCLSYLPLPGMEASGNPDMVSITACNPAGQCETIIMEVLTAVNCPDGPTNDPGNTAGGAAPAGAAPIALDDVFDLSCNTSGTLDVLSNDTDSEGSFNICSFTQTAFGSIALTGGAFTYTPVAGFTGTDSFTYTLCNGSGNATATVSITSSNGANTPPAVNPDFALSDGTATTIDVIGNDIDADGDALSLCDFGQASNGTVAQSGSTLVYTPNAGFSGTDTFTYTACDNSPCGNGSVSGSVNLTVTSNNPGECVEPLEYCTMPATSVVICPEFCSLDGPWSILDATTTFNCSIVIDGDCIIYTPLPGLTPGLTDTVTITACLADGVTCETITISVNIEADCSEPDNGGPVTVNDTATSDGSTVSINPLENDYHSDGDVIFICDFDQPSNGTVELIGDEFFYTPNPGFIGCDTFNYTICDSENNTSEGTVTVCTEGCDNPPLFHCTDSGTSLTVCVEEFCNVSGAYVITELISAFNQGQVITPISDNCFTYVPAPGFLGQDVVTVSVCEVDQNGNPTAICDDVIVNINVQEDCDNNQPPVAVDDGTIFTPADTPIQIFPLDNDFDPDGDNFVICDFTQPMNGSVILVDGQFFTYTPNPGFVGSDSFTYTICDENGNESTATVDIEVIFALANIALYDDQYDVELNKSTVLNVIENDNFPSACEFEMQIVADAPNATVYLNADMTVTFIPEDGFVGKTSFTYSLNSCGTFEDQAKVFVTVKNAELDIFIPNAFSPNGDGVNDEMVVSGLDHFNVDTAESRFIVFNRWGQTIFENDYPLETSSVWDGSTSPGKLATTGTYFYIIEIVDGSEEYKSVGFVELRR